MLAKYPIFTPRKALSPELFAEHFVRAFRYLLVARRLGSNRVATDRALSYWLDAAVHYNANERIAVGPFLAACIAIGDLSIYSSFDNLPFDCSLGLGDGPRAENADLSVGWKRTLAGQIKEPVAPPKLQRQADISFR